MTLEEIALAIEQTYITGEIDLTLLSSVSLHTSICVLSLAGSRTQRHKIEQDCQDIKSIILGTHPNLTVSPILLVGDMQLPILFVHDKTQAFDLFAAWQIINQISPRLVNFNYSVDSIKPLYNIAAFYCIYKKLAIAAMVKKSLSIRPPCNAAAKLTSFAHLVSDDVFDNACEKFIHEILAEQNKIQVYTQEALAK